MKERRLSRVNSRSSGSRTGTAATLQDEPIPEGILIRILPDPRILGSLLGSYRTLNPGSEFYRPGTIVCHTLAKSPCQLAGERGSYMRASSYILRNRSTPNQALFNPTQTP